MVYERIVLRRVQHLEQRGRWVALEGDAELVDLVEQKHRVLGTRLLHALDDAPGHGTDVGAPVAADVGLVARATERDADVLPPHGPCDGLGNRGLADPGWTHEQQDGALGDLVVFLPRQPLRLRCGRAARRLGGSDIHWSRWRFAVGTAYRRRGARLGLLSLAGRLAQLPYRQELEHPVLYVLQSVVVLFQDAGSLPEIEMILGSDVPWQLRDVLEVGPDDLRFHGLPADSLEPGQLPIDFLPGLGGQV